MSPITRNNGRAHKDFVRTKTSKIEGTKPPAGSEPLDISMLKTSRMTSNEPKCAESEQLTINMPSLDEIQAEVHKGPTLRSEEAMQKGKTDKGKTKPVYTRQTGGKNRSQSAIVDSTANLEVHHSTLSDEGRGNSGRSRERKQASWLESYSDPAKVTAASLRKPSLKGAVISKVSPTYHSGATKPAPIISESNVALANLGEEKNKSVEGMIGYDGNLYTCAACSQSGEVVCCDSCPNVYHMSCLPEGESLAILPFQTDADLWHCPDCVAKGKANKATKSLTSMKQNEKQNTSKLKKKSLGSQSGSISTKSENMAMSSTDKQEALDGMKSEVHNVDSARHLAHEHHNREDSPANSKKPRLIQTKKRFGESLKKYLNDHYDNFGNNSSSSRECTIPAKSSRLKIPNKKYASERNKADQIVSSELTTRTVKHTGAETNSNNSLSNRLWNLKHIQVVDSDFFFGSKHNNCIICDKPPENAALVCSVFDKLDHIFCLSCGLIECGIERKELIQGIKRWLCPKCDMMHKIGA